MQKGSESRNVDTESADRNVGVGSVRVDIESAIATVTIERGDSLNALNDEVLTGIVNAMREVERMESIRVVVLRGAGRRAFASGMDLHVLGSYDPAGAQQHFDRLNITLRAIEQVPVPVIAMVYGYALGGGAELAAACDLRIASNTARIGVPVGRFGHCPDRENLKRLLRLLSPADVKAMVMTDTLYCAEEALRMGFFNWVVPESALQAFTYSIATVVSQKSPLGLKAFKKGVAQVLEGSVEHAENPEEDMITSLWATRDLQEGIAAFFERRVPEFKRL
ncbi:Enoyl-CoA hydratase OS=Castellaniella defragrans OX=75697 GN=HNR28_002552 PE=3 SV=1 [Castellaniella defragrans]